MLRLRFFQQSYREAMQPREEKATSLTTADLIRMCRATYSRGFGAPNDMPQNERKIAKRIAAGETS
jgi:hypothetical protein